jgi:hypothetical protein
MSQANQSKQTREYHKPQVIKIDLASDEVLAVGCKTTGNQPAFNHLPCVTRSCATQGS